MLMLMNGRRKDLTKAQKQVPPHPPPSTQHSARHVPSPNPIDGHVKPSQFEAEQQLEDIVNRDTFVLPTHFSPTTQADGER